LQSITDPVGLGYTFQYDSAGHLSRITGPGSRVTQFTVDANGNLAQVIDPDGATTSYGYGAYHRLTTEMNPRQFTATVQYDAFGRVQWEKLFDGTSITYLTGAEESGLLANGGTGSLPMLSSFQRHGHRSARPRDDPHF
jgi:YD repeat-containing protein